MAGTNVNIGTKGDVFVLTEEQRHELIPINRARILDSPIQPDEFDDEPSRTAQESS